MTMASVGLRTPCFSQAELAPDIKQALVSHLWPRNAMAVPIALDAAQEAGKLSAFFSFLRHECDPTMQTNHAAHTYTDLLFLLDTVRGNLDSSIQEIKEVVRSKIAELAVDDRRLSASIEFVVRIWLMINLRTLMPTDRHILQNSIPWADHQSLVQVIQQHIVQPATAPTTVSTRRYFPNHLNTENLRKIGGFRIDWTDDIMCHLTLRGSTIYLFHHVSVLNLMRKSVPGNVLPPTFIYETLATISLLVPHVKPSCNEWLRSEIENRGLDPNIMYRTSATRSTQEYPFWRDRLETISDALEVSKPKNLFQWWHDRRDMKEWWGFWLVLTGIFLTVIFGLIQSVTGIIQVARPTT